MRRWPSYDPASAAAIMPLADWLRLSELPLFRDRLGADYLARVPDYRAEFVATLRALSNNAFHWQVG